MYTYLKLFIIKFFASLILIFAPLSSIAFALGFLIVLDFLTGLYKAFRLKEKITSRRMSESISKIFLYEIAIVAGFVAETYILQGLPLTKIISGFIALTELKSVSENIFEITKIDFYKKILDYIKRNPNKE